MFNGLGLRNIWGIISFGNYFDVFLLQPLQRFLCIFVVLLDEFEHFGQTVGDINVSIDSLTLDSPYEGSRDTSFGDRTSKQNFWLKLANSFVFHGVRSILNIICCYGDVTVGKALEMLGFVKRLSCEFRDPYTLKTLYVSLVHPKLEYTSCVWRPFYGAHIDRIKRVQRKFVRYALRGLEWTDMCDLPPYVDRCALIRLETLAERRANACVIFIFDILSGRVSYLIKLVVFHWYKCSLVPHSSGRFLES
jgi:hypothetical protein